MGALHITSEVSVTQEKFPGAPLPTGVVNKFFRNSSLVDGHTQDTTQHVTTRQDIGVVTYCTLFRARAVPRVLRERGVVLA